MTKLVLNSLMVCYISLDHNKRSELSVEAVKEF